MMDIVEFGSDNKNEFIVSIVCPCYNGENHIRGALDSFIWQNNPLIELIVVDDGSTDSTSAILAEYQKKSPNITVVSVPNGGTGKARNIGIKKAKGSWICFLDSDDMLIQNCFEKNRLLWLKEQEDKGVQIISTPRCKSDMLLKGVYITLPEQVHEIIHNIPRLEFWSCLYRREFFEEKKIGFYEYQEQDIESAFRYKTFSAADKIVVDEKFRFYIQRMNPVSNTNTWNRWVLGYIKGIVYYDLYKTTPILEDKAYLFNIALNQVYYFLSVCIKCGCPERKRLEAVHTLFAQMKKDYREDDSIKTDKKIAKKMLLISAMKVAQKMSLHRKTSEPENKNRGQKYECTFLDWEKVSSMAMSD